MSERRFTEKEASEIVRRAVETQTHLPREGASEGIGEQELRAAARELGIDSNAFERALGDHDRDPIPTKAGLFGGPFRHETEAILDGNIDDDVWEEVVSDLRRTFGEPGKVDKRGAAYEWLATAGGLANTTVTIRNVGNSARLSISCELAGVGFLTYLLTLLPTFVGVAVLSKVNLPLEFLWALGGMATLFLGARQLTVRSAARQKREIAGLTGRVRTLIEGRNLRDRLVSADAKPVDSATDEPISQSQIL